jgi:hypothetical protein
MLICSPESREKPRREERKHPLPRSPASRASGKVSGSGGQAVRVARVGHPRLSPPDRHHAQGKTRMNQSLDIQIAE